MIIAVGDEGFQIDFERSACAHESVVNEGGVFSLNHPHALFQQGIGQGVGPNRNSSLEAKAVDVQKAFGIPGSAGPGVSSERVRRAAITYDFIEDPDEMIAAERRLGGGNKKGGGASGSPWRGGCAQCVPGLSHFGIRKRE